MIVLFFLLDKSISGLMLPLLMRSDDSIREQRIVYRIGEEFCLQADGALREILCATLAGMMLHIIARIHLHAWEGCPGLHGQLAAFEYGSQAKWRIIACLIPSWECPTVVNTQTRSKEEKER